MKIFETNLKYFATLGITRHQAMQHLPFNTENLLRFFNHCLCVSLCIGYLLCEVGFLVAAILTYAFGRMILAILAHITSIVIGMSLYLISLTKDIKGTLNTINICAKTSPQRLKIKKHIIKYLQFHANAKELSLFNVHCLCCKLFKKYLPF